ncbi:MAG TPA: tetratricopeptide repeat protein [Flavitalea sp.]|nr:tetratricopeptide repeat protein [Flavitalea sp.]
MKYLFFHCCLWVAAGFPVTALAQAGTPRETAKAFINQGDYRNAILVLNRAIEKDDINVELKKDLALAYYLQRDYAKALGAAKPLVERADADVQSYQLLGMCYKAVDEIKEAEKMYRAALKKFPASGALHSEYGEILWSKAEFANAAKQWEKGIASDPNYSGNYYNAAKYYYFSTDKVWGLIYGEIFINLESFSARTPEIKSMLLEGYKKLFSEPEINKNQNTKNAFVQAFLTHMKEQSHTIANGVTPDALSVLRTRFLLNWFEKDASRFPFRLFEYHQQLAKTGMFEAYNQWIFAAAKDLAGFQQWIATHPEEYEKFNAFQKSRVFKLPEGQYYQTPVK